MSPPPCLGGRHAGAAGETAKTEWARLRRTFGPFLQPHLGAMLS